MLHTIVNTLKLLSVVKVTAPEDFTVFIKRDKIQFIIISTNSSWA